MNNHKRHYGDNKVGYKYDAVSGVRLRPTNIHKIKCGHHLTVSTFNRMVDKSPKTYNNTLRKYVLQCPICRDIIHVCDW